MRRFALPALLGASLVTMAFAWTQAQAPKPGGGKPAATAARPAAGWEAQAAASVNGAPITWGQLVARMKKENPQALTQSVAQVVGDQVAEDLIGKGNKAQVTVTRDQAYAALRKAPPQFVRQTLQTMIIETALNQESKKQGVQTTDASVNARVTRMFAEARKANQIPANLNDDQFLASIGRSRAQINEQVRRQMLYLGLIEKEMEKEIGHPVGPNDFFQASHILIAVPQPAPDAKEEDKKKADADALAKVTQIAADIQGGKKTFEDAAKENNSDSTRDKGGDLGPFVRGMMVKEFDAATAALKPGEVSKPVRTQFGYHLIKLTKAGKDIPEAERQAILEQHQQRKLQQYVNTLLTEKAKVVNNLPPPPQPMMPGGLQTRER